jgi:hypothetical protein
MCEWFAIRWTGADDWQRYPQVFSIQYILLMRKPEVWEMLNQQEQEFFDRLWYVWRLRRTRKCQLHVRTAAPCGTQPEIRADYRYACKECHASRPLSLLVKGTCVLCINPEDSSAAVAEWSGGGKSHIAQCRTKSCRAFFAVERPEKLLCEPKCYYCLNGELAPTLTCAVCFANHVVPDAPAMKMTAAAKWVCAPCATADTGDSSITQQAPVEALLAENPSMLRALEYAVPPEALKMKLYAAYKQYRHVIIPQAFDEVVEGLRWKNAVVLNCAAVCEELREVVRTAEI